MADFIKAHKIVMVNEGEYANAVGDHGGETYAGISINNFPTWSGWSIVHAITESTNSVQMINALAARNETLQLMVLDFYKYNFWNHIKGDQIASQEIANSLYDSAVNMGAGTAIKIIQDSVFSLPNQTLAKQNKIKDVGINYGHMDEKTLNKINIKV